MTRPFKWDFAVKQSRRRHPKNILQEHLPQGYLKELRDRIDYKFRFSQISGVVTGHKQNAEIKDALYFLAIENILSKLLEA